MRTISRTRLDRLRDFFASSKGVVSAAAVVAFAIALIHGPALGFVYDAFTYWRASITVLDGSDFYEAGRLSMRGALSAIVYIPSVAVTLLLGDDAGPIAVLVQNAILLAVLGAVVIPAIIRLIRPTGAVHVWLSAIATSLLLAGFAPYPLLDLWAVVLLLIGMLLVFRKKPLWLILGGLCLGAAINLRPAYLVPIALGALVWVVFHWSKSWLPAIGAVVAFVPQLIVTRVFAGEWRPWPADTFLITNIQAQYSSFTVRYDTIAFDSTRDPRQFYCNPDFAAHSAISQPGSSLELALAFVRDIPGALLFISEKIAASLHWSWATPYEGPTGSLSPLTPVIVLVSAVGFIALLRRLVSWKKDSNPALVLTLLGIWLGSIATLAFSTPETRFALPIVLIGLVGCLAAVPSTGLSLPRNARIWAWIGAAVVLAVLLLWIGFLGLAHPAAAGDVNALICKAG